MIRILVVDDNAVIRQGVRSLLETLADDIKVTGEAATGKDAIERARELRPDVILLDIRMPVMDGIEAAEILSKEFKVMMLTYAEEEELVGAALRAGAIGYLVLGRFEPEDLERAVREIYAGRPVLAPSVTPAVLEAIRSSPPAEQLPELDRFGLSAREREVMTLVARGLTNKAIGEELFLAEATVKNHVAHIYGKLAVKTRAEATAKWLGALDTDA